MPTDDRAVSEVMGYVLVFTLIMSTVTVLSVGFVDSLEARSDAESVNNAEAAFDVLADNVEDVYARDAPSRGTEISLNTGSLYMGRNVTFEVQLRSGGARAWPPSNPSNNGWKTWSYRPIVFESDEGAKIAYEAGAIFRIGSDAADPSSVSSASQRASIRTRDPPFVFVGDSGDERVLLPVVHPNSSTRRSMSGSTALIRTGTESTSLANVKRYDEGTYENLVVRITDSPRYLEWKQYFEEAGFHNCDVVDSPSHHDRNSEADDLRCEFHPMGSSNTIESVSVVAHRIPIEFEA